MEALKTAINQVKAEQAGLKAELARLRVEAKAAILLDTVRDAGAAITRGAELRAFKASAALQAETHHKSVSMQLEALKNADAYLSECFSSAQREALERATNMMCASHDEYMSYPGHRSQDM